MLQKKKLCVLGLLCCLVFFMIVSYTIHSNNIPFVSKFSFSNTSIIRKNSVKLQQVQHRMCSCPTCLSEPAVSKWFDKRYNQSQRAFLTGEKNQIDSFSLQWWLSLQQSVNNSISDIIRRMFQVISAPSENEVLHPDRCLKCAVVGNSGNLLHYNYGSLIDSHSIVIRMNRATTAGFEQYVGNKTTHHFMYPESAVDLPPGVHLILLPFKPKDFEWLTSALTTGEIKKTYMRVKDFVKADKNKVIVINPSFMKYTYDKWTEGKGRYPSTGFLAIIFALHYCDEVSVFGYGADAHGNWHHYWENNKYAGAFRKTGVHNADLENEIIQMLNTEGKIKLFTKTKNKEVI